RAARVGARRECRAVAGPLQVLVVVELVARRDLRRETDARDLEAFRALRHLARVGHVGELRRIAGVQVREDARNRPVLAFIAQRAVIPQTILDDRAADAARVVPLRQQHAWRRQALVFQRLTEIAADHSAAPAREIDLALDDVAAALRY